MPTTYTKEQIAKLTEQYRQYVAGDYGNDAWSLQNRLRVSLEKGETAEEMIKNTNNTVGDLKPEFAQKFAQVVQRLSIP